MSETKAKVGETVVYHDPSGNPSNALITAVWGPTCINIVLVSSDTQKQDQYGRQIERKASVSHVSTWQAHGNYWRYSDEEPRVFEQPLES